MKLTNRYKLGGATNTIETIAKCIVNDEYNKNQLTFGKYYVIHESCKDKRGGSYWLNNDKGNHGGYSKSDFILLTFGDKFIPKKSDFTPPIYHIEIEGFFVNVKGKIFVSYKYEGSKIYEFGISSIKAFDKEYSKIE